MKKIFEEYKAFALKGNVLDMAVGIVVGGAFATIASSLVTNVIAPVIGLFTSGVDMADLFFVLKDGVQGAPYLTLALANKDGAVTLSYGLFVNSVFSFLIVSWFAFTLVKGINRIKDAESKKEGKATKSCQFCYSVINIKASKCPQCTANVEEIKS
ncbi:MAG: large conductance mechanosensitive channel protein MscL [Cognaticolwellia sp.]